MMVSKGKQLSGSGVRKGKRLSGGVVRQRQVTKTSDWATMVSDKDKRLKGSGVLRRQAIEQLNFWFGRREHKRLGFLFLDEVS